MEEKNVVYFQFSKLKKQSERLEKAQDSPNKENNPEDIIEISDDTESSENEKNSTTSSLDTVGLIDSLDVENFTSEDSDSTVIVPIQGSSSNETIRIPTAQVENNPERANSPEAYEQRSEFLEMNSQSKLTTNNSVPLKLPEQDLNKQLYLQEFSAEQEFTEYNPKLNQLTISQPGPSKLQAAPNNIKQQSDPHNLTDLVPSEASSGESSSSEKMYYSKKYKNKGKDTKQKKIKFTPDFDIFAALPWPFDEKDEPPKYDNEVNNEPNTSQHSIIKTEPTSSQQSNPEEEVNKDIIFIDLTLDDDDE